MRVEEYDLVILGGGTGSTVAAWTFAAEGQRVAVIERRYIGGSCPNIACLPSKNIIHSAKIASYVRRSEEFGVPKKEFTVNMHAVRERKRSMVSGWNAVYLDNYKRAERNSSWAPGALLALELWRSHSQREQRVNCEEGMLSSAQVRAQCSSGIPGLVDAQPLTHIEALELDDLPEHLLAIGGGYVGLEHPRRCADSEAGSV